MTTKTLTWLVIGTMILVIGSTVLLYTTRQKNTVTTKKDAVADPDGD